MRILYCLDQTQGSPQRAADAHFRGGRARAGRPEDRQRPLAGEGCGGGEYDLQVSESRRAGSGEQSLRDRTGAAQLPCRPLCGHCRAEQGRIPGSRVLFV